MEVAEIELAILDIPGIKEAVVVARESPDGEKQLAAYVGSTASPFPSARSLVARLRQRLPDFMVPSVFVILEALPLLPNGKVDRQALPTPDWERRELVGPRIQIPPRGPIEEKLAEIWTEVLGLKQVSAQDDFFELGGHSLLATRLLSRVTSTLGVDLSLRTLFDHPTIQEMALTITQILIERIEPKDVKNAFKERRDISNEKALSVSSGAREPERLIPKMRWTIQASERMSPPCETRKVACLTSKLNGEAGIE